MPSSAAARHRQCLTITNDDDRVELVCDRPTIDHRRTPTSVAPDLHRVPPRAGSFQFRPAGWLDAASPRRAPVRSQPGHHDLALRVAQEERTATALVSLSSPLGIEDMSEDVALPLLAAWHDGAVHLPAPFRAWPRSGPPIPTWPISKSTARRLRRPAGAGHLDVDAAGHRPAGTRAPHLRGRRQAGPGASRPGTGGCGFWHDSRCGGRPSLITRRR